MSGEPASFLFSIASTNCFYDPSDLRPGGVCGEAPPHHADDRRAGPLPALGLGGAYAGRVAERRVATAARNP